MARAARITWAQAVEIFEAPIDPDNVGRFPAPAHVMEGYVHEIFGRMTGDLDVSEFISAWMAWKAERQGFGFTVLDENKPAHAAFFLRYARLNGLIDSRGHGPTRRLWLASERRLYERDASGGRLIIPHPERGAPRRSVLQRHAEVARPVIEGLLRQVIGHPASTGEIPSEWISAYRVPEVLRGRTVEQAFEVIAGLHEGMTLLQGHIRWMWALRSTLMALGDVPEPMPPIEDMAILGSLAP